MQILVNGVGKTYPDGTRALDAVDVSIASGDGVVLLGANGCGKSTLLKCLLGLERVTNGRIAIAGVDIGRARRREVLRLRRSIGSVFQQFNLVGNLTVFQNVLFGRLGSDGLFASLAPTARPELRDQAIACLERVGLADLARRRTDTLSGGQQQRVAFARMLMQDAKLVLADEPVASLDPKAGREVMDLLFEIVRERRMTVVCVLHQLDLAVEYAERIIGLKHGRVAFDAAPTDLDRTTLDSLYDRAPDDAAVPGGDHHHATIEQARATAAV